VGVSADYPPFAVARGEDVVGFDVEVARRFARDTGRGIVLVRFRWPDLERDLAAGRFDVAMSGVTMRADRVLAGTFTRPVVETDAVAVTRYGVAARVRDLDRVGGRIGVNRGGHLERVARRAFPHAEILTTDDNERLGEMLATGAVEAIVLDALEADAQGFGHRLGPLSHDRKAYLGGDPALVGALDAWLAEREADGTLAGLREDWLGDAYAARRTRFDSDLSALAALLDLRLGLMPSVAAAKEAAGLPVEDRAQEARVVAAARARAAGAGLDADSTEALFRAAIAAARAVESAWLATPRDRRPPVAALDLARDARPALARLTNAIVARAADVAREPAALAAADAGRIAAAVDEPLCPASARRALADAIRGLRPASAAQQQPLVQ